MTRSKSGGAIEDNVTELSREAVDVALELQMSLLSNSSAFAEEFADFAARQAAIMSEDIRCLNEVTTPVEAIQVRLSTMRKVFASYVAETGKLHNMTNSAIAETAAAVVSGIPRSDA